MKTGCYNTYKGNDGVGISYIIPSFWKGEIYPQLAPSRNVLLSVKNKTIDRNMYIELYNKHLSSLDINVIYDNLKDKVLLCWEPAGQFCHRQLVAQWIKDNLQIDVEEWQPIKYKSNNTLF